ncbi:MAG: glycosyltransferase, partial [Halobacteriaceae archaeon]
SIFPEQTEFEGLSVWRFFPPNISHLSNGTGENVFTKAIWRQIDTMNLPSVRIVGHILDKIDPDIVHTNNLTGISSGIGRAVQRRDIRHVHTLHDYSLICPRATLLRDFTAPDNERVVCDSPPAPCRLYAKQKQITIGSPDIVTGPSQHIINIHRQHDFFEDTPAERLRLGVDEIIESVPPVPEQRAVLYVGKQLEEKGLNTLFNAAKQLPDTIFHICGTGPYSDTTEEWAASYDNIRYHGFVEEQKLSELRRNVRLAVVPSIWMENSPLTIYENFAVGLPVVGSDIGGIPELITDSVNGKLFAPGDPDSLSAILDKTLSDTDHLSQMKQNAIEWSRKYTMTRHINKLIKEIYSI